MQSGTALALYRENQRHLHPSSMCACSSCLVAFINTVAAPNIEPYLITAPAHISVLNDVFAWFIVPLTAVGRS
jgi:hypothetical protein